MDNVQKTSLLLDRQPYDSQNKTVTLLIQFCYFYLVFDHTEQSNSQFWSPEEKKRDGQNEMRTKSKTNQNHCDK